MTRVVLRVRPDGSIDDLDLSVVEERARSLSGWDTEVNDTRLTDATYVTVVAERAQLDEASVEALREALSGLPRMTAMLWRRSEPEIPVDSADIETFREAAADAER